MEILFEILGEFVLQVVVEALLQGGMHTLAAPFRRQSSPWAAALGYLVFGAVAGGISLWVQCCASTSLPTATCLRWPLGWCGFGLPTDRTVDKPY